MDKACLVEVESLIVHGKDNNKDVAALIVEPIQSEGGDNYGSPEFFRNLRKVCSRLGVAFIVDEVQTGGGPTGSWWAHDHWNLEEPPDLVTFAKKFQTGGYYYRMDFMVHEPSRIVNTWGGDPVRLIVLEKVIEIVNEENLLDQVKQVGNALLGGLKAIQGKYPEKVQNARGLGTFCAIDCSTVELRNKIVAKAAEHGLHIGGGGVRSIRFRPALTFEMKHAKIALEVLEKVVGEAI